MASGNVETLEPSEDAYVTRRGTDANPIFDFGIPKGDKGDDGTVPDLDLILPTDTASGDIASITDGQSVVPVKSLKVTLEPIQDLHGYDKPWSGGNGKNKLDQSAYTSLSDATYSNGTFTATSMSNLNGAFVRLFNGTTQVNTVIRTVAQGERASLAITVDNTWDRMLVGYLMSAQNIGAYFDKPNVPNGEYVVSFTA